MTNHTRFKHIKWWGWGDETTSFDISTRPKLWRYIENAAGMSLNASENTPIHSLSDIQLPPQTIHRNFINDIQVAIKDEQIKLDDYERLLHAYGKSFRDLYRMRNGIVTSAPDCICYPESEDEVQLLIDSAMKNNVVIIPFGGGTNIAGCLEARDKNDRMIVSLDMRRMNRVRSIDKQSMIAHIEAGALGPHIEAILNEQGFTLGHFPDSFEYSSIGGWVATRSAGMQSDKYGKIEDMVLALRMITPSGNLDTRTVPKSSNGINVNHIGIGSEGILGVITEVAIQIHPLPSYKQSYGYLFPNFESGVSAMRECITHQCYPDMTRLNDVDKTALSFAYQRKSSTIKRLLGACFKYYIAYIKRLPINDACLMLVTFSGTKQGAILRKKKAEAIYRRFGAIHLGSAPGRAFEQGKYDFPYLRDFIMDKGCTADVSETATIWSNLLPLYSKAREAILHAITETGVQPWCGCHISHTYHTGASLYYTFAFQQQTDKVLDQYDHVKKAAEDAFMDHGGTLSHHHAVGYEHMPWLERDISAVGIKAVQGIKKELDPKSIMNPGKIISNDSAQ